MASRDIASMHFFLEMKRIFPELPEDVIRKKIHECQYDHKKCLQVLWKEKEKYQGHKQLFPEYLTSFHESNKNHTTGIKLHFDVNKKVPEHIVRGKSELSQKTMYVNKHLNHQVAPSIDAPSKTHSVSIMYKNHTRPGFISQTLSLSPQVQPRNHFMKIDSPLNRSKEFRCMSSPSSMPSNAPKQHRVSLSFIPSPPFSQTTIIPVEPRIIEPSTHSSSSPQSKPGRHVTSVHLELQPDALNKSTVNISTASNDIHMSDKRKYDSCIHISFSSHGTTFSAQRTGFSVQKVGKDNLRSLDIGSSIGTKERNFSNLTDFPSHCPLKVPTRQYGNSCHSVEYCNTLVPEVNILKVGSSSGPSHTENCFFGKPVYIGGHLQDKNRSLQPYVQAVIHHQKLRLEMLKKELERERASSLQIGQKIDEMEKALQVFRSEKNKPILLKMAVLKGDNEILERECKKIFTELRKISRSEGSLSQNS